MLLPSPAPSIHDFTALEHTIRDGIEDIDDLDEFLAEDTEECMRVMLGNAGCIY